MAREGNFRAFFYRRDGRRDMWRRKETEAGFRFRASHDVMVISDEDDDEVEVTYDAREDREREERAQREREEREQRARGRARIL